MIHFDCPQCGKRLSVDSGFRGAVARCDHCGALIHVPEKKRRRGRPAPQPPERPRRPSAPGELTAPAPTRAATPGARSRWLWMVLGGVILLGAVGVGVWVTMGRPTP